MATSLFNGCMAKKIFTRSFIAAYKDRDISRKQLADWIKLSLYFEDPTRTLKPGMIYHETIPKYAELFQTGLCIFAFGFYATQIRAFQKYWLHEWMVTAILGRQTIDHYSRSHLIKCHDISHIATDSIDNSLQKFIGIIEQTGPGYLYQNIQPVDREEGMENDKESQNRDNTPRLKQCYSIELFDRQDREIKLRITSDGLFNCRSFVRDLGFYLNCPSSIDSAHLDKLGPVSSEQSLQKHQLHYEQMVKSAEEITPACIEYLKQLRLQYPDAKDSSRFI
ncbi:hypothetical protein BLA29_000609 [Euroglyphus maynei]|uniref:Uncharacterized protein n=1 Tax=Euroglyphus maynei TaxID=6958 RepID=A0A1Y3ANJ2_EURMA|nr:hypothetical protein BLA29_000609 [Euroglyphus maynei]